MDDRERKRKRDEDRELARLERAEASSKKQKLNGDDTQAVTNGCEEEGLSVADKRRKKRERKKEKEAQQKVKDKEKKKRRTSRFKEEARAAKQETKDGSSKTKPIDESTVNDMEGIDIPDIIEQTVPENHQVSTRETSPEPDSALSHTSEAQPASSTSSPPPSNPDDTEIPTEFLSKPEMPSTPKVEKVVKPTSISIPKPDQEALKARLKARIDQLRTARKADGPDGRPAKSRAELIDSRRKKQETKKLLKKEQRQAAREEEEKLAAETELARLRGSGSPLTNGSDMFSPSVDVSYSFGRIGFGDGSHIGANGEIKDAPRKKGPMDARSALVAAEKKRDRLSGLDDEKRNDIESKDSWLNAKKKIHGERIRDDMSLLKKTLKSKDKSKSKSEREWQERKENVVKGKEMKQKKREDNLAKRRDEKSNKGKKKPKTGLSKKKLKNKAFGNIK